MTRVGPIAPHAPKVGRISRVLGMFHVTGSFWYRFHRFGARIVPEWAKRALVPLFTICFFVMLGRIRRAVAANLAPVLGPAGFVETQRRSWRTLFTFAWCLTERYESLARVLQLSVETDNIAAWHEATRHGGTIVVSAHLGNWEIGSTLPGDQQGLALHLVREPEHDPRAQQFIRNLLAERMGPLYQTHFAGSDPRLGITLLEALRRGEIVALQGDRPRAGGKTVATTLFGQKFDLPAGPFALARSAGVPLLPCFMLREGRGRYRVWLRQPIRVPSTDSRAADLQRAADELGSSIEWAIAREPHQWFCFSEVWG